MFNPRLGFDMNIAERKLYFVRAHYQSPDGLIEFAGHWLAENPRQAIVFAKVEMDTNPYSKSQSQDYVWQARKSKANPESMAMNL